MVEEKERWLNRKELQQQAICIRTDKWQHNSMKFIIALELKIYIVEYEYNHAIIIFRDLYNDHNRLSLYYNYNYAQVQTGLLMNRIIITTQKVFTFLLLWKETQWTWFWHKNKT